MPATSKAQQQFMALCLHGKAKKPCPDMSASKLREYAETPRKGLPDKMPAKKGK